MSIPINDEDLQSATWIVGQRDSKSGVYVTASDIVVKYGRHVNSQREAQTMTFIRENCPEIPVPEVHGSWKANDSNVEYLAMSRMPGTMLSKSWPSLSTPQQESILKDLQAILHHLRKLRAPPTAWIGAIDGGLASDARDRHAEYGGPFQTEAEFNEWLISLIHPESMEYYSSFYIETIRHSLKDHHQLRFAHGDLGLHNILVEDGRITAIIDWEFAGWYPEYWEYIKMIHFARQSSVFRCFARLCWEDENGNQVFYDENYVVDQMLDCQVKHGERVIKRPR